MQWINAINNVNEIDVEINCFLSHLIKTLNKSEDCDEILNRLAMSNKSFCLFVKAVLNWLYVHERYFKKKHTICKLMEIWNSL